MLHFDFKILTNLKFFNILSNSIMQLSISYSYNKYTNKLVDLRNNEKQSNIIVPSWAVL